MRPVLAIDFASRIASVAVAADGVLLAADSPPAGEEAALLRGIDAVLREAGASPGALAGIVALCGPGGFTGLRIACATALALGQALRLPAGGAESLAAIAWSAPAEAERVLAVVDALRGEWFVQLFGAVRPTGMRPELGRAALWRPGEPLAAPLDAVVGHGAARFAAAHGLDVHCCDGFPLAPPVARAASLPGWRWRPERLTHPLYLRPPASTPRRT